MSLPFSPCLPMRAPEPPQRGRWIHEIKHDGYRLIARRIGERVILRTRGGCNWADRYPQVVNSVLALRVNSIVLDGEVACLNRDGISDFDALHSGRNNERASLLAFDVLEIDGTDVRHLPLLERKRRLKKLLRRRDDSIQFVDHLDGNGADIFEHACRLGLEGIVCKRADSIYRAGPSRVWQKVKNRSHASIARIKDAIESGNFPRG
jgi:bifunctional non-homologous end joining protein LigD